MSETAGLSADDLAILDGAIFPVKPSVDFLVVGSDDVLVFTLRGARLYQAAFAKVGMTVRVGDIKTRSALNDLVQTGLEILMDQGDALAARALESGAIPAGQQAIERAYQFGTVKEFLSAGEQLDECRRAGSNVILGPFKGNAAT